MVMQFLLLKCKIFQGKCICLVAGPGPAAGQGEMGQMMSFPVFWCSIVTTRHTALPSAAQYLLTPAYSTTGKVIIYLYFLYKIKYQMAE